MPFLTMYSNVKATSAAVSGTPSCHLMPERMWIVQVLPSAEMPPFWVVGKALARSRVGWLRLP
jgi:hypothetical protein